jgi:GalNAc-alpha-(1->4)-GalNAc-alpha-(1->3)-diNAcBac-PP-undecaprenol alpha-1,4-N-acetyl-D-galactosaminyltransferase
MERVMSELAVYFATKENIEIHLILYDSTREIFFRIPGNIRIYEPPFRFGTKTRFFYIIKTLLYLRKTVNLINPDSVLSFGELWNSFVLIALYGLKYPVFISDRCQPNKSFGKFHDWLRIKLYSKASGIVAQTEKAREIYTTQFNHKNIMVIGNPIKEIAESYIIEKENIVLMVGRLIKSKHQDKLIELFIKISKPGWKLIIVGYDHLKQNISEKLKRIIADRHADHSVILAGKKNDVEAYYLKSKIFAFTSSSEGFPNVIGEAMSAGLPVVAFDCIAGPSEMIRNNYNGFLIPLFDFEQFQKKLELLMNNDHLRELFGHRSKQDIKRFSINLIGDKYLQFILYEY